MRRETGRVHVASGHKERLENPAWAHLLPSLRTRGEWIADTRRAMGAAVERAASRPFAALYWIYMAFKKINVVICHGLRGQPESALKIPFAVVVWPMLKTLVIVPPEGQNYVNKVYLLEAISEIRRRAAAENSFSYFIPLNWKTYFCDAGNVVAVDKEDRWEQLADGARFRSKEIQQFVRDEMARQRAEEWK